MCSFGPETAFFRPKCQIGYGITTARILTTVLKIGKFVVQTPNTNPFHPKYQFEGHQNGQEHIKDSKLLRYWLYIGVVWVVFRI